MEGHDYAPQISARTDAGDCADWWNDVVNLKKQTWKKKLTAKDFCQFVYFFRLIEFEVSIFRVLGLNSSLVHIGTFNYVCFEWQSHFLSPPVLPKTNFPLLFPYSMFVGIFSLFTMLGLKKAIQGSHCRNIRSLLKNILNLRECFSEKDIFQTLTIEKAYLLSLEMISISLSQWQK